jgi:hypothetical protein
MKRMKKMIEMQRKMERISNEFKEIANFRDTCDEIMKLVSLNLQNNKQEISSLDKDKKISTQEKSKINKMKITTTYLKNWN